jgi:hypothetical protein
LPDQLSFYITGVGGRLQRTPSPAQAEMMIQWTTGHNPAALSPAMGVGFCHPVPAHFVAYRIPDAMVVGFPGRADDTPQQAT